MVLRSRKPALSLPKGTPTPGADQVFAAGSAGNKAPESSTHIPESPESINLKPMRPSKAFGGKLRECGVVLALPVLLASTLWCQEAASPVAAPESTVSSKEAKQLFKSVDEILKFASDDTGLPIKHEVKRRLAKRNEVQSYIEKNMKDDKDAKRLERSTEVLKKFGLLPRDFDLPKFLVAMLREQVAGYYDFKTKTVNLLNWVDVEQQKPVLAHELTHALQDQSFGIEKWMRGASDDAEKKKGEKKDDVPSPADIVSDEESSARQAIVEGQAMVVLLDYSLAPTGKTLLDSPQIVEALKQGMLTGTADSPEFRDAPILLKEELTFPYRYGLDFTAALLRAGGKELAYAGAFNNPPKTTRQIMEPQTYLSKEKLDPITMIDMEKDFKDYDPFDIGAMGEFDVDILVEQYSGREAAAAIYPEWRGGYYFAGKPKLRSTSVSKSDKAAPIGLLYVSRWSSPEKAAVFAAIYAKSLTQRYKKYQPLDARWKSPQSIPHPLTRGAPCVAATLGSLKKAASSSKCVVTRSSSAKASTTKRRRPSKQISGESRLPLRQHPRLNNRFASCIIKGSAIIPIPFRSAIAAVRTSSGTAGRDRHHRRQWPVPHARF